MNRHSLNNSDAVELSRLFDLDAPSIPWQPEELGDILAHQLQAGLRQDLETQPTALDGLPPADSKPETFADLLFDENPDCGLLDQVRRFAKTAGQQGTLPHDVAAVLYLSAIAAALRCGHRITSLADRELLNRLNWAAALPWLDERVRSLLADAVEVIGQ